MRYYRILIQGYGGEQCFGSLTKEQYDFWKDMEEEHIISHMIDPYEEDDANPIFDDTDPRWIGEYYEKEDIMHLNATALDTAYITIDEYDGAEYNSKHVKDILDPTDWSELFNKYEEQCIEDNITYEWVNFPKDYPEVKYVFYGASIDKGCFGDYTLELPDDEEFDFMKLKWCQTETPNGEDFIELLSYGEQDLDNCGGDTNGKGMAACVWELNENG
jgi:hypothetical protein